MIFVAACLALCVQAAPPSSRRVERVIADLERVRAEADAETLDAIAASIARLDAEALEERERAVAALVELGVKAVRPVVRAWSASASAETRARLARVLEELWEACGPSSVVWTGRHAVDVRRGTLLWSVEPPQRSCVRDREVLLLDKDGRAWSHDLRTGRLNGGIDARKMPPEARPADVSVPAGRIVPALQDLRARIDCVNEAGAKVWSVAAGAEPVDAIRCVVGDDALFVCAWLDMCCHPPQLTRASVKDGAVAWSVAASNRPVDHSKYRHDARIQLRLDMVILTGVTGMSEYVEAFRMEDGSRLSRWDE